MFCTILTAQLLAHLRGMGAVASVTQRQTDGQTNNQTELQNPPRSPPRTEPLAPPPPEPRPEPVAESQASIPTRPPPSATVQSMIDRPPEIELSDSESEADPADRSTLIDI